MLKNINIERKTNQDAAVVETWVEESAVTAVTLAVVGPLDSQVLGCEDDSRAREPAGVGPFDSGPAVAASARVGETSSSCYMALGLHFFFPSCRHSNRHLCLKAHLCTYVHGA